MVDPRACTLALLVACGGAASPPPVAGHLPQCTEPLVSLERASEIAHAQPARIGKTKVVRITIAGNTTVPERLVREAIQSRKGVPIDATRLGEDIRRIWSLEVFSDVSVATRRARRGLVLEFRVIERPLIGRVFTRQRGGGTYGWKSIELLEGGIYDPARVKRSRQALLKRYQRGGFLEAALEVRGLKRDSGAIDLCFTAASGDRFSIGRVEFQGNRRISDSELRDALEQDQGGLNLPGGALDRETLRQSTDRLLARYYDGGMIEATVGHPRTLIDRRRRRVTLSFPISEGPIYRFDSILIGGDPVADLERYQEVIAIEKGDVFSRSRVQETVRRLQEVEIAHGRSGSSIEPLSEIDGTSHLVDLQFVIVESK